VDVGGIVPRSLIKDYNFINGAYQSFSRLLLKLVKTVSEFNFKA